MSEDIRKMIDKVKNFKEFVNEMKVNGKELGKKEELIYTQKQLRILKNDYENAATAEEQAGMTDSFQYLSKKIKRLKIEIEIQNLTKILEKERNADRFDSLTNQIKKLKDSL